MKRIIFSFLFFFLVVVSFSQCGNNSKGNARSKEISEKLSSQNDNPAFEAISSFSSTDPEVKNILEAKKKIDLARIDLLRVLEPIEDFTDVAAFKSYVIKTQRLTISIREATDFFKEHIIIIIAQSDDGSDYGKTKKMISDTEEGKFTDVANSVLENLNIYMKKWTYIAHV